MLKLLFCLFLGYLLIEALRSYFGDSSRSILGYWGIILCFVLCGVGTGKGMSSISKYVSGASIKVPRCATKSILGTVVCEANLLCGIIECISIHAKIRNQPYSAPCHYIFFASGLLVGACSYFSSISTGIVCGLITMMDAKDPSLFFKLVILEIIPASIGIIGFVIGMFMIEKAGKLPA